MRMIPQVVMIWWIVIGVAWTQGQQGRESPNGGPFSPGPRPEHIAAQRDGQQQRPPGGRPAGKPGRPPEGVPGPGGPRPGPEGVDPPPQSEVELTVVEKGITYKLYRAGLYRVNASSGRWEFLEQVYDPDFYAKNYAERGGAIYRKSEKGELVPVRRRLSEDFENVKTVRDLIGLDRGWTGFTLQSPEAPRVKDYVLLRKRLLAGADYLDNRVEPATEVVHSGKGALKTRSVAPSREMICAKASLDTELLHFVKGDDVWFSGWYHVPEACGMPLTMMDLETTWFKEHPGIRIMIYDGQYAGFELKWGGKPEYRQPRGQEVAFPRGKWVRLRSHLKLSEKEDGVVELWQDGVKIVDARGRTLPQAHTIYNSFEIGISAYSAGPEPATLYVDDVAISDRPID